MKNVFLSVGLLYLMFVSQISAQSINAAIERDVGIVARQLLDYDWQPETAKKDVPEKVLNDFRYWVNITVPGLAFSPETEKLFFHHRTNDTCDAIRMIYEKDGLIVTILQTRITVLLTVKMATTVASDLKTAERAAAITARQVLHRSADSAFEVVHAYDKFWIGEAKESIPSAESKSEVTQVEEHKGVLLLDSWWSDGREIAFFGVKVPPDNKAMVVIVSAMKSLQQNQRWF